MDENVKNQETVQNQELEAKAENGDENVAENDDKKSNVDVNEVRSKYLKELGFDDEESAKEIAKKKKEENENAMTNEQKLANKLNDEKAARAKAEREVAKANAMIEAMKLGAKPDCVEDVIVLAMARTKGKIDTINTVIGEIKSKFPAMFVDLSEANDKMKMGKRGTGNVVRSSVNTNDDADSIGKRLAVMRNSSKKKSSYFSK